MGLIGLAENFEKIDFLKFITCAISAGIISFEFVGHKEIRFVHFALPVLALAAGPVFQRRSNEVKSAIIFINILLAAYFSLVHQRAPGDLMRYFRSDHCRDPDFSAVFFGPCHFIPGEYSGFCRNGRHLDIRQLSCPPPLNNSQNFDHEVAQFYKNPEHFVKKELEKLEKLPKFISFFDIHEHILDRAMASYGYELDRKFFHSHFYPPDQGSSILLYTLY